MMRQWRSLLFLVLSHRQASEFNLYLYDGNENLVNHTDRRGKVTIYQYDGINRRKFAGFGYTGSSDERLSP